MSIKNLQPNPSLCIPKVEQSIREKDIREVFNKLNFGVIDRIDIVSWKKTMNTNQKFARIFIHFKGWNESSFDVRNDLLGGSTYNIVHSFPWYWKIVASRLPKRLVWGRRL